jgi:cytochrome c biogenesis protein ResB
LVTHLAVLLLLLGVVLSWGYGWREEAIIEPGEIADLRNARELALRNEGFEIVRYPDGTVSSYEAELAIIAGGREVQRGTLRVNGPLAYRGVWFYLRGYGGTEGRNQVSVLAVRDPGCPLVITAALLLLLGLTVSFHFPHSWIHVQIEPGGTLRLAGRAGRRAYGFQREFAALVGELRQACAD